MQGLFSDPIMLSKINRPGNFYRPRSSRNHNWQFGAIVGDGIFDLVFSAGREQRLDRLATIGD
jgi:hypothetical protein